MSTTLRLNCLIEGEDIVFPVAAGCNDEVSDLKERIQEKRAQGTLKGIDPHILELWKVKDSNSIAAEPDDTLAERIGLLGDDLSNFADKLGPTRTRFSIFPTQPPSEYIHIIVRVSRTVQATTVNRPVAAPDPTQLLSLNCFVLGDDPDQMFTVKIPKTENVSILKDLIKEKKKPHLDQVAASDLNIWKVSFLVDNLDSKEPPTVGPSLKPHRPLLTVFSLPLDANHIHIAVLVPGVGASLAGSSFPPSSYKNKYPFKLPQRLLHDRESFCQQRQPDAPSHGGKPQIFDKMQNGNAYIACNRPTSHAESLPLSLLHPVFGKFIDDRKHRVPTPNDVKLLHEFVEAMSHIHTLELSRRTAVLSVLSRNGMHINPTTIGSYSTDGDLSVGESRLLIMEFKNEVGSTGAEPYFQAILYYLEATRKLVARRRDSVLPCILVLIFGPYVTFAGAAWTDRPVVQMLSTAIPCHYHDKDIEMEDMLARHLGALRVAIDSLETYYSTDSGPLHRNPMHPYLTTFISRDGSVKRFKYVSGMRGRNLFFGNLDDDGTAVCIKFVTRYCEEAHQFLAEKEFAPKLHAVERLPGGLIMVVMDDVSRDYVTLFSLIQDAPDLHLQEHESDRLSVTEKIRYCLIQLHQAGMVHGDVRNTNIMVKRTSFKDLLLVDYDSSGKIKGVRYPLDLNTTTVKRPEGATGGAVVEVDHDLEMIDYIWDD